MRGQFGNIIVPAVLSLSAVIVVCAGCGRPPLKYESLWESAAKGAVTDIPQHLAKGTAINATDEEGNTALMAAAAAGQLEVIQLLLRKGADVDAKNQAQETAAFVAAANGHAEVVKALIGKGAVVNARDAMGSTMLAAAVQKGDLEVCKVLLEAGADANAVLQDPSLGDLPQRTVLQVAAAAGNTQIVQLLLSKGADLKATDEAGRNRAVQSAENADHKDVADLIRAELKAGDPQAFAALDAKEKEAGCASNLKQLGLALAMYRTDYDDTMPLAPQLPARLEPYTKNPDLWHCPGWDATRPGYLMSKGLVGARDAMVRSPAGAVALFESDRGVEPLVGDARDLVRSARHPSGNTFCFFDGHAKSIPAGEELASGWDISAY